MTRPSWSAFAEACLHSERARDLASRYQLSELAQPLDPAGFLGTCFLLDLFDRLFAAAGPLALPDPLPLLDAGSKDFESAAALHQAFRHGAQARAPRSVRLTGIELDGARVEGGRSWAAAAQEQLDRLGPKVHRYLVGDLLDHREQYPLVTWIHPFLDLETQLEWGLPAPYFRPRELLAHLFERTSPGGLLLIVNQEREESRIQLELLERLRVEGAPVAVRSFELELFFRARDVPAFVHLVRRGTDQR